jgi:glutamyl aminopeptidase
MSVSSQRFTLFADDGKEYPVVSSAVSPHLLRGQSNPSLPSIDEILFDAGFASEEEATDFGVRPGNFIVPVVETVLSANQKRVFSKSWDNRFGLVTILEVLESLKDVDLPVDLIIGANVQEEVGLRGVSGAVEKFKPDVFFALDSSAADDINGNPDAQGQLDNGTLIRVYDPTVVSPVRLVDFLIKTAKDNNINTQYFVSKGGTDAGNAQYQNFGVPSMALGVVSRYIHTHQTVWSIDDFNSAKSLVIAVLKSLNSDIIKGLYN